MHLVIFLEETSSEDVLGVLLPQILGGEHTWELHPHRGKADLMGKLLPKLRGYARMRQPDWRFVVLCDQNAGSCRELKARLLEIGRQAGLTDMLVRIAVTELEAWFLGDAEALESVFPRLRSARISTSARYRYPDRRPRPSNDLDRELKRAGYLEGYLKGRHASEIAQAMDVKRNRSSSFRVFVEGLQRITKGP